MTACCINFVGNFVHSFLTTFYCYFWQTTPHCWSNRYSWPVDLPEINQLHYDAVTAWIYWNRPVSSKIVSSTPSVTLEAAIGTGLRCCCQPPHFASQHICSGQRSSAAESNWNSQGRLRNYSLTWRLQLDWLPEWSARSHADWKGKWWLYCGHWVRARLGSWVRACLFELPVCSRYRSKGSSWC